jgi:nucleotidyltransferase/DNA polymerase involved in DNA repair
MTVLESRKLRDLAGVGKSIEADLIGLGVTSVTELAARDGDELYDQLCIKTRSYQDPCVLDTFRCAVAQARDPKLSTDKCNWWWWSRQRKAGKLTEP